MTKLFLCGDVMLGRGIDQILPHPLPPEIHESFMRSARGYVALAERTNGPVPHPVCFEYVWGEALAVLESERPSARIINLETAITRSDDWVGKGINYRMNPENLRVLAPARIDCAVLSNNHVLDWGLDGLSETLSSLRSSGVHVAGAGADSSSAEAPAIIERGEGRILVFGLAMESSGVPPGWSAGAARAGVAFLPDLSPRSIERIRARIAEWRQPGDLVLVSIHWGDNWGYDVSRAERDFAHALIDRAGVDLLHGHSSHHPKGIEVYRGKLLIYGCGDLIDDYEGIEGYEEFRSDLGAMYFATLSPASGELLGLRIVVTQMYRMQVRRAAPADVEWMASTLSREGEKFGTRFFVVDGALELRLRG